MLNTNLIIKLKQRLPKRYANIVAERTGKNIQQVYKVIGGRLNDAEILNALITLVEERNVEEKELTEKIETVLKIQ